MADIKLLQGLIDQPDNFEIVRDQIALILANETANQKSLAKKQGKDSRLWDLEIFTERNNPYEEFRDDSYDQEKIDYNYIQVPRINVWYDSSSFSKRNGTPTGANRKSASVYNIDCYGAAFSANNPGAGHLPGDEQASYNLARGIRLAQNILMSSRNTYLQMRGVVWGRLVANISTFQAPFDHGNALSVEAARISLEVDFNESSPQYNGDIIESVTTELKRASNGAVIATVQIDYEEE